MLYFYNYYLNLGISIYILKEWALSLRTHALYIRCTYYRREEIFRRPLLYTQILPFPSQFFFSQFQFFPPKLPQFIFHKHPKVNVCLLHIINFTCHIINSVTRSSARRKVCSTSWTLRKTEFIVGNDFVEDLSQNCVKNFINKFRLELRLIYKILPIFVHCSAKTNTLIIASVSQLILYLRSFTKLKL